MRFVHLLVLYCEIQMCICRWQMFVCKVCICIVHAHIYCMFLFECMKHNALCVWRARLHLCFVFKYVLVCLCRRVCCVVVHVCLSLPHPSCRLQLALIKWRPADTHSQFFVQLLLQTAAQQALQ